MTRENRYVHKESVHSQAQDTTEFSQFQLFLSQWLQYLAKRYGGSFHKPDLSLEDDQEEYVDENEDDNDDDDDDDDWKPPAAARHSRNSGLFDSDSEDDEAVAMKGRAKESDSIFEVRVRSQDTRLRENYQQAVARGNVVSLTSTTMARSSMRATFQSISSSVTAMRTSGLQERQVQLEDQSRMMQFPATRMVLNSDFDKVTIAPGEISNGRICL